MVQVLVFHLAVLEQRVHPGADSALGQQQLGDVVAGQRQAAVADGDTGCAPFPEAALGQDLPHLEQRRYRVDQA